MAESEVPKPDMVEGFILNENKDWLAIPHGLIPTSAHYVNGRLLVSVSNWTAKAEYDQNEFDIYLLADADKRPFGTRNLADPTGLSDDISDWWFFKENQKPTGQALRQNGEFVSIRKAGS
jgi:hypothetical protein